MQCHECHDLLQRRLDGEGPVDSVELGRHLAQCVSCRGIYASSELMLKGLKVLPAVALPAQFSQRMAGLVLADRQHRRRRVRARVWVTVALAASVLIMALAGYF